ncbi:hypothetical protein L9F63_020924 [Diploptera punctata]|uniref:Angiomotin C-terminal domain-containing protein n=1 Tax=Diploptera punctata TaxID=6984 RepID=A0AAD7ZPX7_DIPPU|nr:hypothetical protein L9F63_020924 [Diploptera punctata]
MSSIQQSCYIPFTNSAQRAQLQAGGGFSQSLSGSDTDVSTSNENLSHEERYVIRNTPRQEPQGQENLSSNRSSLDVSSSSYNTLIIHGAGDEWQHKRLSGIRDLQDGGTPSYLNNYSGTDGGSKDPSARASFDATSNRHFDPSVREITDIPDDYLNQSQVLKHLAKEVKVVPSNTSSLPIDEGESWQQLKMSHCNVGPDKLSLSRSQPDLSRLGSAKSVTPRAITTSPRPKTHGREDLESQGREIWPPAEMVEILMQENSCLKSELETCYQKVAKSQKLEQEIGKVHRAHEELVQSSERRERLERAARSRLQCDVRRLQEVNRALREQTELLSTQILTGRTQSQSELPDMAAENLRKELGKREIFIAQLITQNKELVAAKERQEIELAAQRATLQEQRTHIAILDTALTNAQGNVVRLEDECRKKQVYVERVSQLQRALQSLQLASDRREQTERKLRLQLEKELRNERAREGEAGQGGSGASGLQNCEDAGDTAPELKRKLRERDEKIMRLEGDVAKWEQRYLEESSLRQAAIDAASIPKDAKIAALEKTSQETEKLIAEARSEKIRHMDEVHAAQKKVADLESRVKDLESKLAERDAMIRVLQKHTYEKDVSSSSYQSMLGRSPHHTPHPSLHGNSDLGTVLGTSVSREELDPVSTTGVFSTVSSVLTSSCSTGISSYAGSDSGAYHHPLGSSYSARKYGSTTNKSFDDTKKSLDDQLKELDSQLDSQLLSKRALCCFPGFANTGTSQRKGKISKPLLAGVGTTSSHLFEPGFLQGLVPNRYEQGRPEEILLLEKQGRSSQQQRMQETCLAGASTGVRNRSGSLPPSSLPRPRRTHKPTGKERRLGEYGRLSDGEGRKTPANSETSEPPKVRSNIPPPRKLGEYGRLSDGENRLIGKAGSTTRVTQGTSPNGKTEDPKMRLFPRTRRGSSLTRESKPSSADSSSGKSVASTGKYRIQF